MRVIGGKRPEGNPDRDIDGSIKSTIIEKLATFSLDG